MSAIVNPATIIDSKTNRMMTTGDMVLVMLVLVLVLFGKTVYDELGCDAANKSA